MNFDDYMKKIQNISNVLEKNSYAEDILNNKEIDVKQDFQYICLSSASNYNLVNEVIARLAQNGNSEIVTENIKSVSMSMWKDLFNKNEAIKKIFIENYDNIFENTTIITFREIEKFINDSETCNLIYNNLDSIIKKLSTYDRASLIGVLKAKENGPEKIRKNLEYFFQKGEFDISTTYSRILIELANIDEIGKIDILKACNKTISEMLNRETAVDNETDKLLNWIYDAVEETAMTDEERAEIQKNIDNAILENFNHILDKSNYDKNTIKILKQFNCTKDMFEKNKNHFIEKSNKLSKQKENFELNNEEKYIKENIQNCRKINEILVNIQEQINSESKNLQNIINEKTNIIEKENLDNIQKSNEYTIKENESIQVNNYEESPTNSDENIDNDIDLELFQEYIQKEEEKQVENQSKTDEEILNDKIQNLISVHLEETDKIIKKALKKEEKIENEKEVEKIEEIIEDTKEIPEELQDIKNIQAEKIEEEDKIYEADNIEENNCNEDNIIDSIQNIKEEDNTKEEQTEIPKGMELITTEESEELIQKNNTIKNFFIKIIKVVKSKIVKEQMGE